jgi:hypothetical protein
VLVMSRRIELGLSAQSQTVLIQKRDSGGISVFISLPQCSVLLECTTHQARTLAAALLETANGDSDVSA